MTRESLPAPVFFPTPAAFRAWLRKHHRSETELLVGFHKKETGKPSITWPDSVDEAICFGWIDGIRRSLGDEAYTIRFTPRRTTSIWSDVNITKANAQIAAGRMQPAGLKAFEARNDAKSGVYSFEAKSVGLSADETAAFRKKPRAWKFWEAQPPGYRRTAAHWVASAKRPGTRARRLESLITDSAAGLRIALLRR